MKIQEDRKIKNLGVFKQSIDFFPFVSFMKKIINKDLVFLTKQITNVFELNTIFAYKNDFIGNTSTGHKMKPKLC